LSEKMKQIKVFFSPLDYNFLKKKSADRNITMSEFIRKSVNSKIKNPPAPKQKKVYKVADPKLLFELNKIGTNLNQIAKKLNSNENIGNTVIIQKLVEIEKKLNELI